ncbi:MAG: sigma-70 family RNA polymerase sigma factor [Oleiphilaceae bacterium]|nr:sigma-70 family RNA polymerase sigma factor [Oleiphilaceae bacterium]
MAHSAYPQLHNLYMDHSHWLQGFLYRQMGCQATAADLAQDTFLRLLTRQQSPQQEEAIEQPRAYLGRIARGLAANHWRRRDIEQAYLQALAQQPEATAPSPETYHVIVETLIRIDALLRDLPTRVRQAFLLSRLEGVRYAAIAESLGVSERMVKKYMAQAMLHCLQLGDDDLP